MLPNYDKVRMQSELWDFWGQGCKEGERRGLGRILEATRRAFWCLGRKPPEVVLGVGDRVKDFRGQGLQGVRAYRVENSGKGSVGRSRTWGKGLKLCVQGLDES